MIVLLMGVSGSGKTTVGERLAEMLDCEFADADDFHSPENVAKMRGGVPLDDLDRESWLDALRSLIGVRLLNKQNLVLACSALKTKYRKRLFVSDGVKLIYLRGSFELIEQRLAERSGHFMNAALLQSQFDALEEPDAGLAIDVAVGVEEIVAQIKKELNLTPELCAVNGR